MPANYCGKLKTGRPGSDFNPIVGGGDDFLVDRYRFSLGRIEEGKHHDRLVLVVVGDVHAKIVPHSVKHALLSKFIVHGGDLGCAGQGGTIFLDALGDELNEGGRDLNAVSPELHIEFSVGVLPDVGADKETQIVVGGNDSHLVTSARVGGIAHVLGQVVDVDGKILMHNGDH